MALPKSSNEVPWPLLRAAVTCDLVGFTTALPAQAIFESVHAVQPDNVRRTVTGRCGRHVVEISYETSSSWSGVRFSDVRLGGQEIPGSAAALSSALGKDYLQNLSVVDCLAHDTPSPRIGLMMTLLQVDEPFGKERLAVRGFEITPGSMKPR